MQHLHRLFSDFDSSMIIVKMRMMDMLFSREMVGVQLFGRDVAS
jgi:hypothetical protein